MMIEHRSASAWTPLNVAVLLFKAAEAKEDDIVQTSGACIVEEYCFRSIAANGVYI